MRVGVDATSWVNRRGYGRFARNVVRRLVALDGDNSYVLYIDEAGAAEADLPAAAERRVVTLRRAPTVAAASGSSRPARDLVRLGRAVAHDGLDAFLFPSVYTYFPVVGVPSIVGIHDAIAESVPGLTLPTRRSRAFWNAKRSLAVRLASQLFTVSHASRVALAATLGLSPERLPVVPEAPDPAFYPRSPRQVAAALATVGVAPDEPFFVYGAGISPHKNVETLLDAYALLLERRGCVPALVLAGQLEDAAYLSAAGTIRERIAQLKLGEHVRLPGYVSDETLARLYSAATAAVVPSLAEGFGLPAVEAAACGSAVLLSDIPAHRESLGAAALYFSPTDAAALADGLDRVWQAPAVSRSLGERAQGVSGRLSWDVSARRLAELIEGVVAAPASAPRMEMALR